MRTKMIWRRGFLTYPQFLWKTRWTKQPMTTDIGARRDWLESDQAGSIRWRYDRT